MQEFDGRKLRNGKKKKCDKKKKVSPGNVNDEILSEFIFLFFHLCIFFSFVFLLTIFTHKPKEIEQEHK